MFKMSAQVGPAWLSLDVVKDRLLSYLNLLVWSDDHTELEIHFMVGVGDRLWNSIGAPPNLGRQQGVLAYAVVTLPRKADETVLNVLARHVLQTLAANYLTTLCQLGGRWNDDEAGGTDPHD